MTKHFLWILLLFGCNSNTDRDTYLKTSSVSDTTLMNKEKIISETKEERNLFDNTEPFKIISFSNAINKNTTDKDTTKCNDWILSNSEIEKIIKNSEPIGGTTWDLSFSVLSCIKTVKIIQAKQLFVVEINAASFFSISNGDTTLLFGDYNKSDRNYFLEHPNDE
jgi:hypothetical protein